MKVEIAEIAQRLVGMREIAGLSQEEMAQATDTSLEEYQASEQGNVDFHFTFLLNCAEKLGVDPIELLTGENPRLSRYSVIRRGEGLPIKRRTGLYYTHLSPWFREKMCEPFLVHAPGQAQQPDTSVRLSHHDGQEFHYILKGKLKFIFEGNPEILEEGDCVLFDSAHDHGVISAGGEECIFLAIILKKAEKEG